jgi:hypothetical protein
MTKTPPWETYSEAALLDLLCGNADAARFVIDIAQCSHAYDDLIDRDKPVPDATVHGLVWKLLVSVPVNAFFRQHQDTIRPVLITAILNWHAATQMEKTGCAEELHVAHALRYALGDVVLLCMALLGGHQYAMDNARRARLMAQADTFAHYASEHPAQEFDHSDPHTD